MLPLNYHHLYYFYTIAKTGSISKACKELRLAQPTLSSQLKQFENYLNLKLFEREGKKLVLTDEGRNILFYAKEIFDIGREMMDGLGDRIQRGRLKIQIGISDFTPRTVIDALLHFILQIEPKVSLSVHKDRIEKMIESLKMHELDFVLTDYPARSPVEGEIENHPLAQIPIVFCAHPSLAKKYKRIPDDLDGAPILLPTPTSHIYQSVQNYFITHNIKPEIIGDIQDIDLVRRLVLRGIGIAPLHEFTVQQTADHETLVIIDKKSTPVIYDSIFLLTKKRKNKHPLIPKIIDQFTLAPEETNQKEKLILSDHLTQM